MRPRLLCLSPIARLPLTPGAAVPPRANLPRAIGSTLVTNPVIFAPIHLFAHRPGATLFGAGEPVETGADLPLLHAFSRRPSKRNFASPASRKRISTVIGRPPARKM